MLIKDLPEVIKKRALECQMEQGRAEDENSDLFDSDNTFIWKVSKEGHEVWRSVDEGNFQPFYDFHKIDQWVPKEGEMVECINSKSSKWGKMTFGAKLSNGKYLCRHNGEYGETNGIYWTYDSVRPIKPSLTRTEIAEKFGVSKDFEFINE